MMGMMGQRTVARRRQHRIEPVRNPERFTRKQKTWLIVAGIALAGFCIWLVL